MVTTMPVNFSVGRISHYAQDVKGCLIVLADDVVLVDTVIATTSFDSAHAHAAPNDDAAAQAFRRRTRQGRVHGTTAPFVSEFIIELVTATATSVGSSAA